MFGQEPPRKSLSTTKPIVGLAICVCLFAVGVMLGFFLICGPGSGTGYGSTTTPSAMRAALVELVAFGPIAGFGVCLVWLLVVLVRKNYEE